MTILQYPYVCVSGFIPERNYMSTQKDSDSTQKLSFARYTLKPVIKPLPSQRETCCSDTKQNQPASRSTKDSPQPSETLRAANEDDDLYDPYSDIHDGTLKPLIFEKDPWN